ncbi:DegT/DnrJ/EryC1/StrS family aminotransferase [Propionivibrio sp.]|uniref:DegT/DnrJ/EryC1/StrS family aminotransferase n=1 Tax=Propionivibrio sp. TaxID=2212460 RepID=UPI003BF02636
MSVEVKTFCVRIVVHLPDLDYGHLKTWDEEEGDVKHPKNLKQKVLSPMMAPRYEAVTVLAREYKMTTATLYAWRCWEPGWCCPAMVGMRSSGADRPNLPWCWKRRLWPRRSLVKLPSSGLYPQQVQSWRSAKADRQRIREREKDLGRKARALAEKAGTVRRPTVPRECVHNAHMYYLLLPSLDQRTSFIERLKSKDIHSMFHYIPLHSSPRGLTIGRAVGDMTNTDNAGERLVRLPLWLGLEEEQTEVIRKVIEVVDEAISRVKGE